MTLDIFCINMYQPALKSSNTKALVSCRAACVESGSQLRTNASGDRSRSILPEFQVYLTEVLSRYGQINHQLRLSTSAKALSRRKAKLEMQPSRPSGQSATNSWSFLSCEKQRLWLGIFFKHRFGVIIW